MIKAKQCTSVCPWIIATQSCRYSNFQFYQTRRQLSKIKINGIKRLFFKEKPPPPQTHFICYTARALFFIVLYCVVYCVRGLDQCAQSGVHSLM